MRENQRVRLTKQLLRINLIDLLETKSIHDISVREVCSRAEINRTTFYRHYGGVYDLLKDIEKDVVARIADYIPEDETDSSELFVQLLIYFHTNVKLIRLLLNNCVDPEFPMELMNHHGIHEALTTSLRHHNNDEEIKYLYNFIFTGGLSIVKDWLNKEQRESPEKMAQFMTNIIRRLY